MIGNRHLAVLSVAASLALLGSGCATTKQMALTKEAPAAALDQQHALALATVRVDNQFKTDYQPKVQHLLVKVLDEKGEKLAFQVGKPFRASEDPAAQYEEFLVSMSLAPGPHELQFVFTSVNTFLLHGTGFIQVNAKFKAAPGQAVYLGRLEARRRERVGDEPRAGIVIPLIDQGVTGFSGGAWDAQVVDRYDADLALFRAEFPSLQSVQVVKQLLDQPKQPPEPPPAKPE